MPSESKHLTAGDPTRPRASTLSRLAIRPPVGPPNDGSMEGPRFSWSMAGAMFIAGATIGAFSLLVPHPQAFDDAMLWQNIAISYVGALACFAAALWATVLWPQHLMLAAGTVLATRAAYYSGDATGFYTLFYVWIGLFGFFFFRRRWAVLHIGFVGAAYAWLLAEFDVDGALASWITTIGTVGLAAFMIDSLVRRVRSLARGHAEIARQLEELLGTLRAVARTDDLTGLPNRRAWDEELARELSRARRDSSPLCAGFIDLDRFKEYNDDHGHQAGDRLLKEIAAAWRQELRAIDVIARYGGEEFSVVLPGCDIDDARSLIERLRRVVPENQTCSGGVVLWDGVEDGDALLGRADKALYAAKAAGRDRVVSG